MTKIIFLNTSSNSPQKNLFHRLTLTSISTYCHSYSIRQINLYNKVLFHYSSSAKFGNNLAFCYRGAGGAPQNDFCPPKDVSPPKIFKKTIERAIETIAYCFKKTMVYCLPPPPPPFKFFSSRKPDRTVITESHDSSMFGVNVPIQVSA